MEKRDAEKKSPRLLRRLGAACLPRPGCFTVSAADEGPSGYGAGEGGGGARRPAPAHLVVTMIPTEHLGNFQTEESAAWQHSLISFGFEKYFCENWRYAAKHFIKKHPEDVVVHCSGCNVAARTFDGVDVMGRRLAEEVLSVVESRPELRKISFVAHSLGGLIARYAIALLYESATQTDSHEGHEKHVTDVSSNQPIDRGKIAGLDPINFITFATPHLGTRSHKQIPLLRGSYKLEKMAYRLSWIAGRSGKHLFLKDTEDGKPPLLLQMVTDYGGLHFISVIVGWRTSSIRHQHELPKSSYNLTLECPLHQPQNFISDARYPHVVYVEEPKAQDIDFSDSMIYQAKATSEMEEVMLKGLNRIPWERVDVSFKKSRQRIFAHSTIQVKTLLELFWEKYSRSRGVGCMHPINFRPARQLIARITAIDFFSAHAVVPSFQIDLKQLYYLPSCPLQRSFTPGRICNGHGAGPVDHPYFGIKASSMSSALLLLHLLSFLSLKLQ
uniref:DUF676 domain-containing protein n=1 Tax=Oryza brachyantha TaxID=4533 RepID=J3LSE8_ORYBR